METVVKDAQERRWGKIGQRQPNPDTGFFNSDQREVVAVPGGGWGCYGRWEERIL